MESKKKQNKWTSKTASQLQRTGGSKKGGLKRGEKVLREIKRSNFTVSKLVSHEHERQESMGNIVNNCII